MLLYKKHIYLFCLFILCGQVFSQENKSLIRFTENKNQWQDFILFRAQLDGGALFVEKNALTYGFYDKETYRNMHTSNKPAKPIKKTGFKVVFPNANQFVQVESFNAARDYNNYFIGKDKTHWAGNVKNYQKLLYKNLWQNINLEILGQDNSVKYNFYVKPGADASKVQLSYDKTGNISIKKKQLIIKTPLNEMVEHEPYAYQIINGKTVEVACNFQLKKNIVSFLFPNGYNKNYELVIDPVLVFACTSGSTADNFGFSGTYDAQGNLYSGGIAFEQGYPTVNAYDSTFNGVLTTGLVDVVITKYDSSGTFLHYSTYLGGVNSSETVTSLIVDSQNNLFLFGATGSSDFPTTSQAYDNSFNGGIGETFTGSGSYFNSGSDLYVTKLSAAGNQLLASTFIGGSDNDGLNLNNSANAALSGGEAGPDSLEYNYGDQYRGEIQLDNLGNPVISSCSRSTDFPTKNAIDATLGGWQDAVVFKFDPTLSQLQWSTFIGGSDNDAGYGLTIAKNNDVYTTGGTRSNDFPTTTGAYSTTYHGGACDGYITKISANGNNLLAATYIGTSDYDQSFFIQLDKSENVYVYGQAAGILPIVSVLYSDTNSTQFVTKLTNNLSNIIFSTNIGNGNGLINISPTAFLIDYCEHIYISGWGGNLKTSLPTFNMPLKNAIQSSNPDGYNFYMMELAKNSDSLLFGTYYGGSLSLEHVHGGTSRYDKRGIVYQALCTSCGGSKIYNIPIHQDFPLYPASAWPGTPGTPNHNSQNYNCTEATFKIDFKNPLVIASYIANKYGCAPLTVNFTDVSTNATSFLWNFGAGDTTSLVKNPIRTYNTAGTYTAMLLAYNPTTCNLSDTSIISITVYPQAVAGYTIVYDSCKNGLTAVNTSTISSGNLSYYWNFGNGQTDTTHNPGNINYQIGTYTTSLVTTSINGCNDSTKQVVHFNIIPVNSYPDTAFCAGNSLQLNASGGTAYHWQPATGLTNANISNPIATPSVTTIYTVTIPQIDGGGRTCNFKLMDSITVYPKVIAAFNYSPNACGNTVSFRDSSYANVTSWQWNFGDTLMDSIKNPSHSYYHVGTYTVSLVANNQYNCPDSTTKVITLTGFNPIGISKSTTVCKNNQVQLNAFGGISYTWTPAANLNNANINNPIATPTSTTHYTLSLMQANGTVTCTSVIYTNIFVPFYSSNTLTTFAHPDTIIDGTSSQLGAYVTGGNIIWYPDENLTNDTSLNPLASPHHTTTYTATYLDPHGCIFPLSKVTIYVLSNGCNENTVFLPNTFTPNGDGKNDVLYARSGFVYDIHLVVADRWGQIVFETYDITKGWDGNFNGKPCNPDVFGYFITYKCTDGKESFKKGNVTLIR